MHRMYAHSQAIVKHTQNTHIKIAFGLALSLYVDA